MRIELTSPYSRTVTTALKAGTGTSSVTSPFRVNVKNEDRRMTMGTRMKKPLAEPDYT